MIVDVYYVLCTADYIFMHVEILVHLLKLVANGAVGVAGIRYGT